MKFPHLAKRKLSFPSAWLSKNEQALSGFPARTAQALLSLGFDGPFSGGRHEFLVRNNRRLILPNPHRGDVSADLLARLLKQADISREEWEATA